MGNGKIFTPTRKIVAEDVTSSPNGSCLARSPAMHEGFRTEDWVVKRTPVNTPASTEPGADNKIIVGVRINKKI